MNYAQQESTLIQSQDIIITLYKKAKLIESITLNKAELIIGKDKNADVKLSGFSLSKIHAKLVFNGHYWSVQDMSSMAGTYVNRERIIEYVQLTEADTIKIQDYELHCRPAQPTTMKQQAIKPLPMANKNIQWAAEETQPNFAAHEVATEIQAHTTTQTVTQTPMHVKNEHRQRLHAEVIQTLDLRRQDISSLGQQDIKALTRETALELLKNWHEPIDDVDALIDAVFHDIAGFGPLELLLQDPSVSEIMVNCATEIFVEQNGTIQKSPLTFTDDNAVLAVIDRIITPLGRRIDHSSPMVDARLPDGSRVNAIIPPLAIKGPCITIRKFPAKRLEIDDLIDFGSMDQAMAEFFKVAVSEGKNILVSGGTGTGKTTLLNVLSNLIPMHERVITIEDAAELKLNQPDLVSLESKPANTEGTGAIHIRDLVKNALRMRPNRIVVGECRGAEALDMLQAMNTGHDGSLTTLHANTPRDALSRLEVMVMMAGMDIPVQAIREQMCSAVHVIVQQTRFPCGSRKITHVSEVVGIEAGVIQLQDIFVYKRKGINAQGKIEGKFMPTGFIPSFYETLAEFGKPQNTDIYTQNYLGAGA